MKSIYVSRKVLNAEPIVKWAQQNGYKNISPVDDLHVTVAYSKRPVDETSLELCNKKVALPLEGRSVDHFGDYNVIKLDSKYLQERWQYFMSKNCSYDFPDYSPHISFSKDEDLLNNYPYLGDILLGPEILEDLNDDS